MNTLLEPLQQWAFDALPVLLDVAVKGMVLLAIAGVLVLAMRKASAAARQAVWLLALAALLALPIVSTTLPSWRVLPGWVKFEVPVESAEPASPSPADSSPAELGWTGPFPGTDQADMRAVAPAASIDDTFESGTSSPPSVAYEQAPQAATDTTAADSSATPSGGRSRWTWVVPLSVAIWLAGTIACLLPLLLGRISLWRLARHSRPITGGVWATLSQRAAQAVGLTRRVSLLQSSDETMPMVWGTFRPKLLLPAEAEHWPVERRWVVLLHELAHAKRRDRLAKLVAHVACAFYWFNPLCWMAFKLMQREAEAACDDLVLSSRALEASSGGEPSSVRPSDYAEHLLEIASGLESGMLATYSSIAMARKSKLEGRLLAILDAARSRRALTRIGIIIVAALIAAVAIPLAIMKATGQDNAESVTQPATQPTAEDQELLRLMQQIRLVDDPDAAIRAALPAGEHPRLAIQRVESPSSPFYREEGDGVAYYIGRPLEDLPHLPDGTIDHSRMKQEYSLVLWIMPPAYEGRVQGDWTSHQTSTPALILSAVNGKVYSWPGASSDAMALLDAIAPLPREVAARRDDLLAAADTSIRTGLIKLAEDFPQLKQSAAWNELTRASRPGRIGISLGNPQHASKSGAATAERAEDVFAVGVFLRAPSIELQQMVTWGLLPNLRLVGQVHTGANDPQLGAALKRLVDTSLRPLHDLNNLFQPQETEPPATQPAETPAPRTVAEVLATRPAPKIEGLAERSRPGITDWDATKEAFYDILKLRDLADPKAVPELVKILASNAGTGRIHGHAAAQALFCIGSEEAMAALDRHLTRLEEYTERLGPLYAFGWDMPEPHRSKYIAQYWLRPIGDDLELTVEAKSQPDGTTQFTLIVKNVSDKTLDVLDPPIGRLYVRGKDGRFLLNRPTGIKEDVLGARWMRLKPGDTQTFRTAGQVKTAEDVRKDYPHVPKGVQEVFVLPAEHYYISQPGQHDAVFVLEQVPLTAEAKELVGIENPWAGRAVSKPVAVQLVSPAAQSKPMSEKALKLYRAVRAEPKRLGIILQYMNMPTSKHPNLVLHTGRPRPQPHLVQAELTREQAVRLIDVLARLGFFEDVTVTVSERGILPLAPMPKNPPGYLLTVRLETDTVYKPKLSMFGDPGSDERVRQILEAFAGQLAGEPKAAVAKVLAQLPATQPGDEWGKANNGVQARLRADKLECKVGEMPTFWVDLRNQGEGEYSVAQAQQLCSLELDGVRYTWAGAVRVKSSPFWPGRYYSDIPIVLTDDWVKVKVTPEGNEIAGTEKLQLTSGRHRLRVIFFCHGTDDNKDLVVESNSVEFEIAAPDVGSTTGMPPTTESKVLGMAFADTLSEMVAKTRQETGELPPEATKPGFLVRNMEMMKDRFPSLFMVSAREEAEFEAGRFHDDDNKERMRQSLHKLEDYEADLPSMSQFLIHKLVNGTLEGAQLEFAARLLSAHVDEAGATAERTDAEQAAPPDED